MRQNPDWPLVVHDGQQDFYVLPKARYAEFAETEQERRNKLAAAFESIAQRASAYAKEQGLTDEILADLLADE